MSYQRKSNLERYQYCFLSLVWEIRKGMGEGAAAQQIIVWPTRSLFLTFSPPFFVIQPFYKIKMNFNRSLQEPDIENNRFQVFGDR